MVIKMKIAKAVNVAKYLILISGYKISNLWINAALYQIYKDFYKTYNISLFSDEFFAWNFTAIIPEVYYAFCHFGAEPIASYEEIDECKLRLPPSVKEFLNHEYQALKNLKVFELVSLNNKSGGAWDKINKKMKKSIIPKKLIITEIIKEGKNNGK